MSLLQFTNALDDKSFTSAQKHSAFQTFSQYYDQLKTAVLGSHTFSDQQLSEQIFKHSWKESHQELVFKKHLFAANNTIQRLIQVVTPANFAEYEFLIKMLSYDLYDIVVYAEKTYRNTTLNYKMGSRIDQNAREIFDISRALFHFGTLNPSNFYLREVIPVSIFLLRQTIEIYGKRTLGFHSITDEQGNRISNVSTNVAWDFIKKETLKPSSRITLPVNIDVIRRIETWTNRYVHTGYIPDVFLIENAIQLILPLIYPQNSTERDYNNSIRFAGTTIIRDYNALKSDFEKFIRRQNKKNWIKKCWTRIMIKIKLKKKPKRRIVNWYNPDSVDATIKNL